jgi:hypothetical protein
MENGIPIPSFEGAIPAGRISPARAERLTELLGVSARRHGQTYRGQKFEEHKQADSLVERIKQRKVVEEEHLVGARERLSALPSGGWAAGAVTLGAFVACFGSEVVFNRAILPWILGVAPDSVLGTALAIAPASAPLILDRVMAVLLHLTPVQTAVSSAVTARVRGIARSVFLVLAALVTLCGVWLLADARAVASDIMNNPNATGMDPEQQHVVNLALLLVSLALTVNGALFYIYGAHEIKQARAKAKARAEVGMSETRLAAVCDELAKAVPAAEIARSKWDRIDEMERAVVDAFLSDGRIRLAEAMERPVPVEPAHVRVKQMLDRRLSLASAAR